MRQSTCVIQRGALLTAPSLPLPLPSAGLALSYTHFLFNDFDGLRGAEFYDSQKVQLGSRVHNLYVFFKTQKIEIDRESYNSEQ